MKIKWLGHACFLLTSNSGVRILTDPFDRKVGYAMPVVDADIITVSHDHYDHNNAGMVKGNFAYFNKPGKFSKNGVEISGAATYHDDQKGMKRGGNIVFKFDIDGIKVCHCGDIGHALLPGQAGEIGEVDVLLVPVGGTYTVDAAGALEIVKLLKPLITIPMHYKTEVLSFPIDGADKFLAASGGGKRVGKQEIELGKDNMHGFSGIVALDFK